MTEYIREVEKEIDNYHKKNSFFKMNKKNALFMALTVFEDSCRLGGTTNIALMGESLEYSMMIRSHLDAIDVLLQWINEDCDDEVNDILDRSVPANKYMLAAKLMLEEAKPYSPICSAYISYSRGYHTVDVNEKSKRITFNDIPENRNIVVTDISESITRDRKINIAPPAHSSVKKVKKMLKDSICFEGGAIDFSLDEEIWGFYKVPFERQWSGTSELPEEWELDKFSINEFKLFWVSLATYCMIHMTACIESGKKVAT